MKNIGIIGAGIAGLHLGLFLRQHGIAATIYTEKTPEQLRASRLANMVVRFAPTRERERLLGVNHWDSAETDLMGISYYIGGDRPLAFTGDLTSQPNVVDMRIYCARLLEDFAMRGGRVVIGALQASDVEHLAVEHDLMVVQPAAAAWPLYSRACLSTRPIASHSGWLWGGPTAGSATRSRWC